MLALLAACGSTRQAATPSYVDDPSVIAVIDGRPISVAEFEERYARSVGGREAAADDSLGAYQEFLQRYVDFRLKVLAGQQAGFHTSPELEEEIQTYRQQLARPYLLEQEVVEPVIRQLYTRQQEVLDASHILLRVEPDAAPDDTLAAYRRLQAIRDSLLQGADFAELAARHSEDPSARREMGPGARGRLGYFSAGRMVQEFEDAAYATPEGEISPIFRTQFGYHVLRINDRRPNPPDVHVAHLMLRAGQTAEDSAQALARMQELKERLAAGEEFAELARQYSADEGSGAKGGDLGVLSFEAPVPPSFRDAAFALEEPGDVSDVVETPFGLHLIRLVERNERPDYQQAYSELKKTAARMPRTREAERAFAREALLRAGARVDTAYVVGLFDGVRADSVYHRLATRSLPEEALAHVFMEVGDSTYTVSDLADYTQQIEVARTTSAVEQARNIVGQFVTRVAVDHEATTLEQHDEEFRRTMEEFRDGLVLFKLMEDSVWTAAEQDSAGLAAYFERHAGDYRWPDRTRIIGLSSPSDSLLQRLDERLDGGAALADLVAEIAADSTSRVRVDTMRLAGPSGTVYDRGLALEAGRRSDPVAYERGYIILVNDGVEPARPKRFEEARPEVVAEYQKVLEAELLNSLRSRFRAQTFPDRLDGVFGADVVADTGSAQPSSEQ